MRDRIERAMVAWGHFVCRHAVLALVVVLSGVAALATQLPRLEFDTSIESFLHPDDPLMARYNAFRRQFGRDELVLLAVRPREVFDPVYLERLRSLHEAIEDEVPRLHEVTSLVNARRTRGEVDRLVVGELFEDWPETPEQLAELRDFALANPLYRNALLSADGRVTAIVIETEVYSEPLVESDVLAGFDDEPMAGASGPSERRFLSGAENSEIVEAIREVAERYRAPDFEIHLAGTPVMMDHMQRLMRADMARFTGLAVIGIAILLALLFRRLAGVVLPLVVVLVSLVSTLSCLVISGFRMTLPLQILPSFLLAVGVGASVHVLTIFFQRQRRGESREEAIANALGHTGLAITMTSLTTAGGLLSFSVADLAPISHFGLFGPLGMMICLLMTVVLLPALVSLFPIAARPAEVGDTPSQRVLVGTGGFAIRNAGAIVLAIAVVVAISLAGALRIRFSHDPTAWLQEDDPFKIATDVVNEELRGAMSLELLVDTGRENGLHEPVVLGRMDDLHAHAEALRVGDLFVGKTLSLVDVSKEIHRALNEDRPEFYAIPQERSLVAQELLLFENSGSDDLEDLVDSRFALGRMTLRMPFLDAIQYRPFLEEFEVDARRILGEDLGLTLTGMMGVMGRTLNAVVYSMAKSYLVALVVITPLMVLLIGNLRIGLLSMVPNLAPILVTLGVMGWGDVPIDTFTLMVGSIAIGLAVDDTIHFMHNFRRYYERSGSVAEGVSSTLRSTGQAMLFTSLVLCGGFGLFTLSSLNNLFTFGMLVCFTVSLAFVADLVLSPALIALVMRGREPSAVASAELEASR